MAVINKIQISGETYDIGGSSGVSIDEVKDLMSCVNNTSFITLNDAVGYNGNIFGGSGVYQGYNLCYNIDSINFDASYSNKTQYDNFIVNKEVVDQYAEQGNYGVSGRFMCLLFTKEQAESFLASNDSRVNDLSWAPINGLTEDAVSGKVYKGKINNMVNISRLQSAVNYLNNYPTMYKYIAYLGNDWLNINYDTNKLTWNGANGYCNKFSIVVGVSYSYGQGSYDTLWSIIDPNESIIGYNSIATFDKAKQLYDGCTIAERLSAKQNALNAENLVNGMGVNVFGNLYYYAKNSNTNASESKDIKVAKINGENIVDNSTQKDFSLATKDELNEKQDKLVSGVNIATINNSSILQGTNLSLVKSDELSYSGETDFANVSIPKGTFNGNYPFYNSSESGITYINNSMLSYPTLVECDGRVNSFGFTLFLNAEDCEKFIEKHPDIAGLYDWHMSQKEQFKDYRVFSNLSVEAYVEGQADSLTNLYNKYGASYVYVLISTIDGNNIDITPSTPIKIGDIGNPSVREASLAFYIKEGVQSSYYNFNVFGLDYISYNYETSFTFKKNIQKYYGANTIKSELDKKASKCELDKKQDKMTNNYLSKVDVGGSSISIETKAFKDESVQKTDTINFKTINGQAIFGMGDIKINVDTSNLVTKDEFNSTVGDIETLLSQI